MEDPNHYERVKVLSLQPLAGCSAAVQQLFADIQWPQDKINIAHGTGSTGAHSEAMKQQSSAAGNEQSNTLQPTQQTRPPETNSFAKANRWGGDAPPQETASEYHAPKREGGVRKFFHQLLNTGPQDDESHYCNENAPIYRETWIATVDKDALHPKHPIHRLGFLYHEDRGPPIQASFFVVRAVRQAADGVWYHAGSLKEMEGDQPWKAPLHAKATFYYGDFWPAAEQLRSKLHNEYALRQVRPTISAGAY